MTGRPQVSVIIPTYNRRDLVRRAIRSVFEQTDPVDEIIVVDDGSGDGTREALHSEFGDRIQYMWQPNAGVSAARNRGLAQSQGKYLTLLDSDDEWLPEKTRLQRTFLEAHPEFGMVLCDVIRMTAEHKDFEVFRRRDFIPHDGWVLPWVLANPALAPASAMFRREVLDTVGGFDASLRTAEDIDFHLRVARHWRIGIVEQPLVRAMRDHEGLSALNQTYDDYIRVVERFTQQHRGVLTQQDLDRGLSLAYSRNARGLVLTGRLREGVKLAGRAWFVARGSREKQAALEILPLALKRALRTALRIRPRTAG
jgi:glycosyltransferase involved in cell wall biosynthesis